MLVHALLLRVLRRLTQRLYPAISILPVSCNSGKKLTDDFAVHAADLFEDVWLRFGGVRDSGGSEGNSQEGPEGQRSEVGKRGC